MRLKLQHPGLGMSVALCFLVIGLQMAISTPIYILDEVLKRTTGGSFSGFASQPLMMALVNVLAFAGTLWLALYLNRLSFWKAFEWQRLSLGQVLGLVVMVLGCIVIISEADNLLRRVLPVPKWFTDMMKDFLKDGDPFSRFFLLVIVAPFTEELLFRGLILRGLYKRFGGLVAILLSSLLFGLVHLNPWQFVTALLLGLILGWAYLRTGSVWLCVLGHALVNGAFFLVTTLEPQIPGMAPTHEDTTVAFQPWWLDVAGVALVGTGIWLFHRATLTPPVEDPEDPPVIANYRPPLPPIIPSM